MAILLQIRKKYWYFCRLVTWTILFIYLFFAKTITLNSLQAVIKLLQRFYILKQTKWSEIRETRAMPKEAKIFW